MNPRLVALAVLMVSVSTLGQVRPGKTPSAPLIKHVVIIFQENRTPDNLFQDPVLISRGADIATQGLNSKGQLITLQPGSLIQNYDLGHSHIGFTLQYDKGKMDASDKAFVYCPKTAAKCPCSNYATQHKISCPLANPVFSYVDPAEVQPYFQLAEQYTFNDRMFQTNQGPSFPAHQIIISGTSAPTATSNLFVAENVVPEGARAGCIAKPGNTVLLIDPQGKETQAMYPCTEHASLTDLLKNAGISWRYYTPSAGSIWTGPNGIEHMCGPNNPLPNATACLGSDWNNVSMPPSNVLSDISSGQLAQVSWVMPSGDASDHANGNIGLGPSWVASIVNAIGSSAYWQDTAIFITWDDWGGWYDHVAPPILNSYEYGFRVPLIVVSPYAKPAYISHVTHDFGSILQFIEHTYNLPSLGYADATATSLSDCFNFKQKPLAYKSIAAPVSADYFLKSLDTSDPDDD
jgi:phospholipase C